jgi:hypothetical protein
MNENAYFLVAKHAMPASVFIFSDNSEVNYYHGTWYGRHAPHFISLQNILMMIDSIKSKYIKNTVKMVI